MLRFLVWAVVVGLVTGCGLEEEGVVGRVTAVEVPDTVEAGRPFTATVTTSGPDGCWTKERTDVVVSGLAATITPYDVDTGSAGVLCTQALVAIIHTAELTFGEVGTGLLTVHGRDGTDTRVDIVVTEQGVQGTPGS